MSTHDVCAIAVSRLQFNKRLWRNLGENKKNIEKTILSVVFSHEKMTTNINVDYVYIYTQINTMAQTSHIHTIML